MKLYSNNENEKFEQYNKPARKTLRRAVSLQKQGIRTRRVNTLLRAAERVISR